MVEVAKKYQDNLCRIKKNVERAYEYFKPNYQRYHEFNKFVFLSSLTDDDISLLKTLKKPQVEFNILEAYISRLRGEFSKQEPSIEVMPDYDYPLDPQTTKIVEGHIRHILKEGNKNGAEYSVYTDMLAGGFSVMKIWTDYANDKSFNQCIKWGRVYDPTLCGFDPLAKESHKGDGRFCFELFPRTKDEFKEEYPDIDLSQLKFTRDNIEGYNWSYKTQNEDVLMICDYYEKKKKRTKIVLLANNQAMTIDKYNEFLSKWEQSGAIQQPPSVVKSRYSEIETICRYRVIESQVLEYIETDYKMLPLVFADGNSVYIRDNVNSSIQQHTRPYVYNAKGVQKLKNFAGQTLAHELENLVQHKFKVPKEGIPSGYEDAYTDIQSMNTLLYNAFKDNDPNVPLPPPQEIVRPPVPPEIASTFMAMDQTTQGILGSYDASLGINNNQLSGIAIVEGATQSNSAAMPYIVGFLAALNQIAQIALDLIPKYYVTPRTIPIVGLDGKKSYVKINGNQGVKLNYPDNVLNVSVEAGVNFSVQKSRALQQIIALMQASPLFAQFMNTDGLEVLLDNLEIRGIDQLKVMSQQFIQKQQQMAEQAQQNNPEIVKAKTEQQKVEIQAHQAGIDANLKAAEIAVEKDKVDNERIKYILDSNEAAEERAVRIEQQQTEKTRAAVDLAISVTDMKHKQIMDVNRFHNESGELAHKIHEAKESRSKELKEH
jgi:hypothetical protein